MKSAVLSPSAASDSASNSGSSALISSISGCSFLTTASSEPPISFVRLLNIRSISFSHWSPRGRTTPPYIISAGIGPNELTSSRAVSNPPVVRRSGGTDPPMPVGPSYSTSNMAPTESPLWMRWIPSPKSEATERTLTLESRFSAGSSRVSVTTNSWTTLSMRMRDA